MEFLINLKKRAKYLFIKENIYFFIFIIFIFFLDRFSKLKIVNNFNEATYYVNDFVNLNLIWNIGIGFGLLSTDSFLMYNLITLLIGLVIIILIYFLTKSKK